VEQLIIFEGISGGGKTTLFTPVHRARNYEDLHIHRFTPTQWVYAQLHDRSVKVEQLQAVEQALEKIVPTLVVWCRPDPQVALDRKLAEGDPNLMEGDFVKADHLYWRYFNEVSTFTRVIELATDKLSVDTCVEIIIEVLREYEDPRS